MTNVTLISVVGTLDGKPLRDLCGRRAAGRLCTPAESFGTVGAIAAVQHANEPIVCIKVGGFYFHQTYEYSHGNREYMVYMDHPDNGSLIYVGTVHGKALTGEVVTVGPTKTDRAGLRINGYMKNEERTMFLRAAERVVS